MQFKRTTAVNKVLKMTHRKRVIDGGTSAGKTVVILAVLIDRALKTPNLEISVISESIPHLRRGALKDFLSILKNTGRYSSNCYNKTLLKYTFPNGSYIEFFSAQDEQGARRDILYVNEAIYIPFKIYHHYAVRTRQEIYVDYNPSYSFWVHEEMIGKPDVEHLTLTYKDNEALEQSIINEIESARDKMHTSEYWRNWWTVYGLGQLGQLQGAIFDNHTTGDYPDDCDYQYLGIDFGFSKDPAAVTLVGRKGNIIYLKELVHQTGLLNSELIAKIKASGYSHISGVADSAEPKTIAEMNAEGLRVHKSPKGTDSVRAGIKLMQDFEFVIDPASTNVLKSFRRYSWDDKKEGKPAHDWSDSIDSVRYVCFKHFRSGQVTRSSLGSMPSSQTF